MYINSFFIDKQSQQKNNNNDQRILDFEKKIKFKWKTVQTSFHLKKGKPTFT